MNEANQHCKAAPELQLSNYPEKCEHCGSPARTELNISDYPVGHDWFQYCVNPKCIQFDYAEVNAFREKMRNSKSFRRWRARLWKTLIAEHRQAQLRRAA